LPIRTNLGLSSTAWKSNLTAGLKPRYENHRAYY
jgi:hypothetical protein